MRKLVLLPLLAFLIPAGAQQRYISGSLRDARPDCAGDTVPRLGPDGKLALICLPTANVELPWFVPNPAVAATSFVKHFLPNKQAGRVTSLVCATDTGTVDLNFDSRHKTDIDTPGTDLHTSEMVADSDSVTVTTFAGDDENAANQAWVLSISAVSGTPGLLSCWMTVERL